MWSGPTFQSYYIAIPKLTRELLDKEEARYLLTVDFEDYLDYLESELKWDTQEWYPDRMTAEQFVAKVPRRDRFGNGQITVEVQCVRLRIPLAPHPQRKDYFKLGPFATWGSQPEFGFEGDILILEVEATEAAVQRGKEEVDFWLGNRNKDIESGNRELRDKIKNVWETRRQQLQEGFGATDDLLKKLNLPLHQDPNAKVKPIEIKERQLRTVVKKPSKNVPTDPSLSRDDVNGLVDFIDQYLKQFEVSPKAYSDTDEEPLRDILVGMMNANYPPVPREKHSAN